MGMSEENRTDLQDEAPSLEEIPAVSGELVESDEDDEPNYDDLMPQMNVGVPALPPPPIETLIENDALLGIYGEILGMLRDEHKQVTEYIDNFAEMVVNQGDSTTSSKETLVGLVKIRTDIPDKMTRIADLMTRVKMKERDTYKPYLQANQTNNVVIGDTSGERRTLLDAIKKAKKKGSK